jgi:hypothetical protein
MTAQEVSRATLAAILATGVDHVLVGGLAINMYAFARSTMDVDFVVAAPLSFIDRIAEHFPAPFHLDFQPQMELLTGTYRWLVEVDATEFKVEIFHLGEDLHHHEIFRRRRSEFSPEFGREVWLPTAEDLVIQKLRWARNKDLDDARNILAVQGEAIDYAHIEKWCAQHGTLERLAEVRAGIPPGL